jgi:ribosomal protein L17
MSPQEELRRGEDARRILEEPLLKEAFKVIEERIINSIAVVEIDKERAEYLRTILVASRKVRQYLEQVVTSGKLASMDEERKSFMDTMRRFVPH